MLLHFFPSLIYYIFCVCRSESYDVGGKERCSAFGLAYFGSPSIYHKEWACLWFISSFYTLCDPGVESSWNSRRNYSFQLSLCCAWYVQSPFSSYRYYMQEIFFPLLMRILGSFSVINDILFVSKISPFCPREWLW